MLRKGWLPIVLIIVLAALIVLSGFFFFRIDLTSDKRYSVSPQTKILMETLQNPITVTVYLDGDLNSGFLRLKRATTELLDELAIYAHRNLDVKYENPSAAESPAKRQQKYHELAERGMLPVPVYERDREDKMTQKLVFPWVEIEYADTIVTLNLLKKVPGLSGEENINASIENLEYEWTDVIRRLTMTRVDRIAFLEGHNELSDAQLHDAMTALSYYFQVDRGTLNQDATVLDGYKVVIVAKPTEAFSESDKYIIDQYIMNGGRVLWLLDGVRLSRESLSTTGLSPSIELDVNLKDMLFQYGVRINPVLLQDVQSVLQRVNVAPEGEEPHFESYPWVYAPLLLTSYLHAVTRNVTEVKADFTSALELVGEKPGIQAHLLLATSDNTHVIHTPATIDVNNQPDLNDKAYFNTGYVPVAVALNGIFESAFAHRMTPRGVHNPKATRKESVETRQIVVADGDIIRNDVIANQALPLGYDLSMDQQFGNRDFIQNAVLYLADNDGWIDLRARTVKLSLLNKREVSEHRAMWQIVNVVVPVVVLLLFGLSYQLIRRKKYR